MLAFGAIAQMAIAGVAASEDVEFFLPLSVFTFEAPAMPAVAGASIPLPASVFSLGESDIEPSARTRRPRVAAVTV